MTGFIVDKDKTLNAALYVLNAVGKADYHKVFKILYFAEQHHLRKYGRPVTGDSYQAMQYGPVPSYLFDVFKASENGYHPFAEAMSVSHLFKVERQGKVPYVEATQAANWDELSVSDVEALNQSINDNAGLSFKGLVDKSHDSAWEKSEKNEDIEMSYLDIAEASGIDKDMLQYVQLQSENSISRLI